MRPITRTTICALAAAAMAAPAFAASNIYLELGPIKGESSDRSAAGGKIEVSSFQFGVTRKGWDGTIKGRPPGEESATAGGGAVAPEKCRCRT